MIVVLGDLHNPPPSWASELVYNAAGEPDAVIQVGDLGWAPGRMKGWGHVPWKYHFIDGNHDHLPSLLKHEEPAEVAPGLIYCPRGSTLTLDGRRVGFLGGAKSIDREWRVEGKEWWPEEELTPEDADPLRDQAIDLLITHCPPRSVMTAMLRHRPDDQTSLVVQAIWEELGKPQLICGHMHRRYLDGRVLVLGDQDAEVI